MEGTMGDEEHDKSIIEKTIETVKDIATKASDAAKCESASNLDPWRNRYNALQSNDFREKEGVTVGRRSNTPGISNSASASTIW
jgi:hypothetical protein